MLPRRQNCRFPGSVNTGSGNTGIRASSSSGSSRAVAPYGRNMRDGGLYKARHEALAGRPRNAGTYCKIIH